MSKPLDHTLDAIRAMCDIPEEKLEAHMTAGAWVDVVRHLLGVVDRQHAMLAEHQWDGADDTCPACKHFDPEGGPSDAAVYVGHDPGCALATLLRETA